MKNHVKSSVFVALSFCAFTVVAAPVNLIMDVYCPMTQGPNALTNFGDYVAGYGMENILSQNNPIYFRSPTLPANMPASLVNYFNEAVAYESTSGTVSCSYMSNMPTEPRFLVRYTITNGQGATVMGQSSNSLNLMLPVGLQG